MDFLRRLIGFRFWENQTSLPLSVNVDDLSEKDKFQFLMSVTEYDCIIPVLY